MKTLFQLEEEFEEANTNPITFIKFYESNVESINALQDSDSKARQYKTSLTVKYGLALSERGSIAKARDVLSAALPELESESGLTEEELKEEPFFEQGVWTYGISLYYNNKRDEAEKVFRRLVRLYPDNDKYKNWLRGTVGKKYGALRKVLYVLVFTWLALDIVIVRQQSWSIAKFLFLTAGVITLVILVGIEAYVHILKRNVR